MGYVKPLFPIPLNLCLGISRETTIQCIAIYVTFQPHSATTPIHPTCPEFQWGIGFGGRLGNGVLTDLGYSSIYQNVVKSQRIGIEPLRLHFIEKIMTMFFFSAFFPHKNRLKT